MWESFQPQSSPWKTHIRDTPYECNEVEKLSSPCHVSEYIRELTRQKPYECNELEKLSSPCRTSEVIRELTQGRRPTNVLNAETLSTPCHTSEDIRELRWENPCKGTKCEKTFSHQAALENIKELTQVRSIMNLMNVVKLNREIKPWVHQRNHKGLKSYQCNEFGKTLKQKSNLGNTSKHSPRKRNPMNLEEFRFHIIPQRTSENLLRKNPMNV